MEESRLKKMSVFLGETYGPWVKLLFINPKDQSPRKVGANGGEAHGNGFSSLVGGLKKKLADRNRCARMGGKSG